MTATRILIYTHAFAPKVGGVESVVMSLATGLAGLCRADEIPTADVTVVTPTPRGGFDDASLSFVLVRQPSVSHLVRLIRAADVIHLSGPCLVPMLVGWLLRKPIVVEHHGFQTICPNGQLLHEPTHTLCPGHFMAGHHGECVRCNAKKGWVPSLTSWFLTFPRRWLCTSAKCNIMPTKWLAGLLRLPRSTTIYHGLSGGNIHELAATAAALPTFAFVGRLVSAKGVQVLLQAAGRLRTEDFQFRVKVIGDGPDREFLENQVADLGLEETVKFLGYVAPDRLEEHLCDVSTIVMPSLAGEVFGLVTAENMLRGKLLIVSDIGSMSELIADAGLSFAPGDVEGLVYCMKRVLQDPALPTQLGIEAQRRALKEFDQDKMLVRHLDVYSQVSGFRELAARCVTPKRQTTLPKGG